MQRNFKNKIKFAVCILFITFLTIYPAFEKSHAAGISIVSDQMSRMKKTAGNPNQVYSNHTITFTTATGVAAGETIVITFPSDFIGQASIDYTDVDMYATTERTLDATPLAGVWGAAFSSVGGTRNVLTLTSGTGTVTAASSVVIEIGTNALEGATGDKQIENTTTTGSKLVTITAGGTDTGSYAVSIVDDDQIVYTATVDPTISVVFAADLAISFGTLTASSIASGDSTPTVTVGTNAQSGFTARVYDAGGGGNPGLYKSVATTDLIGSSTAAYANTATLVAGTEGYGINATATGGSGSGTFSIDARFAGAGNDVGGLEVGAGAAVTLASDTLACTGRIITIDAKAAITDMNLAGSYTDTVTVIVTGNF